MFKRGKCLNQRCIFTTLKKIIFSLFIVVLFSVNVKAQCTPPGDIPFSLVELDSVLIPQDDFISSNGVVFEQPINLNLPLCPDNAIQGTGCTQVELEVIDYNGLGLDYSGAILKVFWTDIWNNQINAAGDVLSSDSNFDNCIYDLTFDSPFSLQEYGISDNDTNPFYFPGWESDLNNNQTMDLTAVIIYRCADDPFTPENEEENICDCFSVDFEVENPEDFDVVFNETDVSCFNGNDGTMTTNSTGGVGPFIYDWDFIDDSFTGGVLDDEGTLVTGLSAGDYNLTIEDTGVPCTYQYFFSIEEPAILEADFTVENASCNGLEDGEITVQASGGNGNYIYELLVNGVIEITNNNGFFSGLGSGTYSIIVTDSNDCILPIDFDIEEPDEIEITTTISDYNGFQIQCFGGTNGSIDVSSVFGGSGAGYTYLWGNGSTGSSLSGLSAGTYTLIVTDSDGCQEDFDFILNDPDEIIVSLDVSSVISLGCFGNLGNINLDVNGGTGVGTYTYLWDNGAITENLPNLTPGSYSVTVTDDNNCEGSATYLVEEASEIDIQLDAGLSILNIPCFGDSDGSIIIEVGGGTPDVNGEYTYLWTTTNGIIPTGTETNQDLNTLVAGDYLVTVSDSNGCTETDSYTITQEDEIIINLLTPSFELELECFGDSIALDIDVSGGTGPGTYTYVWIDDSFPPVVSFSPDPPDPLDGGVYTVTVTDGNGCEATEIYTVIEPAEITIELDLSSNIDLECFGDTDGLININVTGGEFGGPYNYLWNTGATTEEISGLSVGTYEVTVTDRGGCSSTASYIITSPSEIIVDLDLSSNIDLECFGDSDGNLDIEVLGGNGPFTYLWNTGATSQDISSLFAGNYTVTITDSEGCDFTWIYTVNEPDEINIELQEAISLSDLLCFGDSDGNLDIEVSGGTPDINSEYTYIWTTINGSIPVGTDADQDLNGLVAGDYTVTVEDSNECIMTETYTITEPSEISVIDENINLGCFGEGNASISIEVVGGTPDINGEYTYLWDNGDITQDITDLIPGTYSVTITDSNGCQTIESWTIAEPDDIIIDLGPNTLLETLCFGDNDGSIDIEVAGGTLVNNSEYTYLWTTPNGIIPLGTDTGQDLSDLVPGDYTIIVTDDNGCEATETYIISEPDELIISLDATSVLELLCSDDEYGQIDITVLGGTGSNIYLWNNGATTEDISNLGIGSYSLTVEDSNGCISEFSADIEAPDPLIISDPIITYCNDFDDPATTAIECGGEVFIATITGGIPGYEIVITDPGGNTETIIEPASTSYSATNLCNGTYFISVTDDNGCNITLSYVIEYGDLQPLTTDLFNNGVLVDDGEVGFCTGDIAVVLATSSGGGDPYTYTWYDANIGPPAILVNSPVITFNTPGNYSLITTNAAGCITENIFTVVEYPELQVNIGSNSQCYGEDSYLYIVNDPVGGEAPYFYEWYYDIDDNGLDINDPLISSGPNQTFISVTDFGTYYLVVTDDNGCTVQISDVIFWPGDIGLDVVEIIPTCPLECNGQITFTPDLTSLIPFSFDSFDLYYSVADIDGDGINNLDQDGNILDPDIDGDGIDNFGPDGIEGNGDDDPDIDGDGILNEVDDLTTISPYSILVQASSFTIESLCAGEYYAIAVSVGEDNCESFLEFFEIPEYDQLVINSIVPTDALCFGENSGSVTIDVFGGSGNQSYDLLLDGVTTGNTGPIVSSPFVINNLIAGNYTIIILDDQCEDIQENFIIGEPDEINIELQAASLIDLICFGDSDGSIDIEVNGGTPDNNGEYIYLWTTINGSIPSGTDTDQDLNGLVAGDYTVTVEDSNECIMTETYIITEPEEFGVTYNYGDVICYGFNDGFIDLTVTGPGTFTYIWNTGQTSQDLVNLGPGTYVVDVSSDLGCGEESLTIDIIEPPEIFIDLQVSSFTDLLCFGDTDGSLDIEVSGGTLDINSEYTYLWTTSNGIIPVGTDTDQDLNGLIAGDYTITVTDDNGCVMVENYTITEPPEIFIDLQVSSFTDLLCFGDTDGSLDIEVSGGTPDINSEYTYLWTTPNGIIPVGTDTDQDLNDLVAGDYTITVTDDNGCIMVENYIVTEPPEIFIDLQVSSFTDLLCFGDTDGSLDIEVSGGTPDINSEYTYLWTTPNGIIPVGTDTDQDLNDLVSGDYTITVTDDNGCVMVENYTVTEPTELNVSASVIEISCYGQNDASIDITVTGGTPDGLGNYIYLWNTTDITQDLTGLGPGLYSLLVTDDNGCEESIDVDIIEYPPIEIDSDIDLDGDINDNITPYDYSEYVCAGESDGFISFNINGGVAPIDFQLYNGVPAGALIQQNNSGIFNGLTSGQYTVLIYDAIYPTNPNPNCEVEVPIEIIESNPIISIVQEVESGCDTNGDSTGGFIEFNFPGGILPYNLYLNLNGTLLEQELGYMSDNYLFDGLFEGDYEFIIEDSEGCTDSQLFTIDDVVNIMDITAINPVDQICWSSYDAPWNTGSVTIDFTASYEVPGFSNFGTLNIYFDENNDCILDVNDVFVQDVDIPNAANLSELTVSANQLYPGNYVFEILDNGFNTSSCLLIGCFTLNEIVEPDPEIFFTSVDPLCFEGSGSAYVSGDPLDVGGTPFQTEPYYDVVWSYYDDNGTLTDLPLDFVSVDALTATSLYADVSPYSGDYMVTITDANGCVFEHNFTIEQPPNTLLPGLSWLNNVCYGECAGEITIQPFGGVGNFYVLEIAQAGLDQIFGTIDDILVLNNEILTVGVEDTHIESNLCAGEYQITVGDGVCPPVIETIIITEPEIIEWTFGTELACAGDVIDWSELVNYYVYEGGTGPPDIYWFADDDCDGEPNMGSVNINALTAPGLSEDINSLSHGCYYLLSVDAAGCETIHDHEIEETPQFIAEVDVDNSELWIYCNGDNTAIIDITVEYEYEDGTQEPVLATENITYLWYYDANEDGVTDLNEYLPAYNNETTVTDLASGNYIVLVNNENNCGPFVVNISVLEPDPVTVVEDPSNYNGYGISCNGEADGFINLIPSPVDPSSPDEIYGYIYTWTATNGGVIPIGDENEQNLNNLVPGTYIYSIQVDIPLGESFLSTCAANGSIDIVEPGVLDYSAIPTNISCNGAGDGEIEIIVTGGASPYTYSWIGDNGVIGSATTSLTPYNIGVDLPENNGLPIGSYVIEVNDANGCGPIAIGNPVVLTEPDILQASVSSGITSISTNCGPGLGTDNNGVIQIDYTDVFSQLLGGNPPYSIEFIQGPNGVINSSQAIDDGTYITFYNLEEGDYTINIADTEQCPISISAEISTLNPFPLDLTFLIEADKCGSSGSILISSLSTLPGVPPYTLNMTNSNGGSYSISGIEPVDDIDPAWNPNDFGWADPNVDGDGFDNEVDGDIDGDDILNPDDLTPYGSEPEFDGSPYGFYQSLPAGDYTIDVIDENGCVGGSFNVTIPGPESFGFDIVAGSCYWGIDNTCEETSNDGQIIINPNTLSTDATLYPYFIYIDGELHNDTFVGEWGTNSTTGEFEPYIIDGLEAGTTYSISIIDANGCGYADNNNYYEIPFNSNLNVEIIGFCPECQEASNGGFGYTFLTFEDEVVSGLNPDVTIQEFGPSNNQNISILYTEGAVQDCLPDPNNSTIVFEDNTLEEDYYYVDDQWLNNVPDPNALVGYHEDYLGNLEASTDHLVGGLSYGTYNITILDPDNGCQFTQEIDISDENCRSEFGSQNWNNCLFIPSVFTPNADGINDLWDIYNIELYEPGVNIKVFNRWGQIVYQNDDNEYSSNLWDGVNMKGKDVEIATYYYVVEVDIDSEQKKYTGYVVVKR